MARDYENMHDLEDLDDVELRDLVRERLGEAGSLDLDNITVLVRDGVVHLTGRVGTEGELRIAEHVLTDQIGISDYENELIVDPIRRTENPDDPEDAALAEAESDYLGERAGDHGDEVEQVTDDLEVRLNGTSDVQRAISQGLAYEPPTEPTPEGYGGAERGPETYSEDH